MMTDDEVDALNRKADFAKVCSDILNAFDGGVRSCVGIESSGNIVWKGSFIAYMERLRALMPPEQS